MKYIYRFVIIFCIVLFVSCGGNRVNKNEFIAMGTYLEVISDSSKAAGLVNNEAKRLEKIFNTYDPDSEISLLNNTYDTAVKVSDELIEVLLIADRINTITQGAFDVTCGSLYDYWKEKISSKSLIKLLDQSEIEIFKALCDKEGLVISREKKTVTIKKKGLKIDLSAIAKGYIVDKCIKRLQEEGINSALINAGGDLYCLGENNYQKWRVGLRDPRIKAGILESYELKDQAMATSGDYEQFFELDGKRYSHIIDPRDGYPVNDSRVSVSVVAKSAVLADSLATAFYVLDIDVIKEVINQNNLDVEVFVVGEDDEVIALK